MAAISIGACAERGEPERSVVLPQTLRIPCAPTNHGLACDPDGLLGPLTECQGLCELDPVSTTPNRVCVPISELGVANLQKYPCGPSLCSHTCNPAGQCVPVAAENGTACFVGFAIDKCTGQCVAGTCRLIPEAERCDVGQDSNGCGYRTCETLAAKTCKTVPYAPGATCTGGTCDGCGVCGAAPANCRCGNGQLDPNELCDGTDLDRQTCASVTMGALPAGTLSCSSTCTFVTTGCVAAGTGGTGGAPAVDASADGRAGSAGSGGVGGVAAGGAAGSGNAGGAAAGSGGISSEGGVAGSAAAFGRGRVAEGGGCDCGVVRSVSSRGPAALAALALALAWSRRRRRCT